MRDDASLPAPSTKPVLTLRYDLRCPSFGRPAGEMYATALEQARWAEAHGFAGVTISEHHSSDDGYCPSPIPLAAALAGATSRLRITIAALLVPLYDPIRLAEDLAVTDLASGGRLTAVFGAGYRETECNLFGITLADRVRRLEEGIGVLRQAWTGEPFEYRGHTVRVTPRPLQQPSIPIVLAGSTKGSARRAARLADGFAPVSPDLYAVYAEECAKLGKPCGPAPGRGGPLFLYVSDDPERDWALIAPHALHETNSYGRWLNEGPEAGPYQPMDDVAALRASGSYRVVTPEECLELARQVDVLTFHALMGGLPPDVSWRSLELFASEVLPHLRDDEAALAAAPA